jgi:hypothetical protein
VDAFGLLPSLFPTQKLSIREIAKVDLQRIFSLSELLGEITGI